MRCVVLSHWSSMLADESFLLPPPGAMRFFERAAKTTADGTFMRCSRFELTVRVSRRARAFRFGRRRTNHSPTSLCGWEFKEEDVVLPQDIMFACPPRRR